MRAKGTASAWLAGISAWFLLLAFLLGGVYFLTHAYGFFEQEYAKYDAASDIGVSQEDLMTITTGVLDYLNEKRDNLDMQAEINGQRMEVFTQREKDHMVDVLFLIRLGRWALLASAAIGGALLSVAIVLAAKNRSGKKMCIGYLVGAGSFLAVGGVIAACFVMDFTKAFYIFHTIFFNNDLWMLPSDAVMIKMVPEEFFSDCALVLAAFFVGGLLLTCIPAFVCALCLKDKGQDEAARIQTKRGSDGDSYFEIEAQETERPEADEIFQRLGLQDEEEAYGDDDEVPAALFYPSTAKMDEEKGAGTMETNLSLEMKLDLRIMETENGLELVPDPEKPLDIRVAAKKGELKMLVQALDKRDNKLRLNVSNEKAASVPVESSAQQKLQDLQAEVDKLRRQAADMQGEKNTYAPKRADRYAPTPSVDELLKRMNDMMRGYPKDERRGEDSDV